MFETWIFLTESFGFFGKVRRNVKIITHREDYLRIEVGSIQKQILTQRRLFTQSMKKGVTRKRNSLTFRVDQLGLEPRTSRL